MRRRARNGTPTAPCSRKVSPLAAKNVATPALPTGLTFKAAAERYIANHRAGWQNPKHAQQWTNTLGIYVFGAFGGKTARDVTQDDVLAVLHPLWHKKMETAILLRSRIETVLDAAEG